jgi:anti-sigma28 factor (negative regulator of flagellin synthesis)
MTPSESKASRMADDAKNGQTQRLETLKDLVRRSAYDVPSEEVAARIIGHAFGLPAPPSPSRT